MPHPPRHHARSGTTRLYVRGRFALVLWVALGVLLAGTSAGAAQEDAAPPLISAAVDALPATPALIEISRLTLASGAGVENNVPGPVMYGVETGTLGIRLDRAAVITRAASAEQPARPEAAAPEIDYTLRSGDQIVAPAGTLHLLFNDGQESASIFSATVFPATAAVPSWLPGAELPPGVNHLPIASDFVAGPGKLPSGPVHVTLDRLTVPAGEELPDLGSTALALVVVEAGVLTVAQDGEPESSLAAGEVARVMGGEPIRARNAGDSPLEALVFRLDERPETGTAES